ncbi:membrane protein [Paenibacillus swuensis]|uniref:Membrane protein n=1 Tax=Paenibacillus swuensis TaxID=1178515 RepID=A0A172TN41_9BACL|nr:hemolysin family protein [Paenibacillus swuensis]ANE48458.1 membrane protein [Paenibacillus swuensis]
MEHFEWGKIALNLSLVLFLVLLNGFFVAAEFSLVKVRQSRLTQLVNEGNKRAKYALTVNKKLDAYLSATQLGITLASLGLGWVGEPAINELIVEPLFHKFGFDMTSSWMHTISFAIAFLVITFLHIVIGELAPKSLAIQKSELTSLWLSGPLMLFYKLFMPAIWFLNGAANRLLKLFGVEPASEHEAAHTEEEIRILVTQSAKTGHIDKDEMRLVDNIFEFSERLAREVMLPRTDMECLYTSVPFEENLRTVYATKHTRYPVAHEDKDDIIGFVHITDMLTTDLTSNPDIRSMVRPILNVPESMEISQVLKLMQRKASQLAIVVDEYGGTAGMLTTEEILEEIVGEIHDEFDKGYRPSIEVLDHITSVEGRTLLEEVNDMFGLHMEDEEVDSIGGWMFKQLEGNLEENRKVEVGNYVFEAAEMDRLRILRVHIYQKDKKPVKDL